MDLLGGLAFLGYINNNNNNNDNKPIDNYTIKSNKKDREDREYSGDNIMNNNRLKKVNKKIRDKARAKTKLSRNPSATGVIPPYYNSNRSKENTNNIQKKYNKKYDPIEDSDFSEGFSEK